MNDYPTRQNAAYYTPTPIGRVLPRSGSHLWAEDYHIIARPYMPFSAPAPRRPLNLQTAVSRLQGILDDLKQPPQPPRPDHDQTHNGTVHTPKRRQKKIKVKDCSVVLTNFNSTSQQHPYHYQNINDQIQHLPPTLSAHLMATPFMMLGPTCTAPTTNSISTSYGDPLHDAGTYMYKTNTTGTTSLHRTASGRPDSPLSSNPRDSATPQPADIAVPIPEGMTEEEFNEFVDLDADVECNGDPSEEEICQEVRESRGTTFTTTEAEDDVDFESSPPPVPSSAEVSTALDVLRRWMQCHDDSWYSHFARIEGIVQEINQQRQGVEKA
ncbi:TIGD4 [Branchiostoma lanceolatum]|uniref:TIGD4 protein n=1 Tax=Branchiostoma lanceolatum TaxID=7740 RepID=A0A8K0E555_BRALA|nr:TIGD4 [Branchiostoma lanceolatum]